jgi:hypothetical protein
MPMGDGLVGWILHQADAAIIDLVHPAGILRDVACRAALQNNYLQSRSGGYFFGHHQTAPPTADYDYVRGLQLLQPGPPSGYLSDIDPNRRRQTKRVLSCIDNINVDT